MEGYAAESLYFLPTIFDSETSLGLKEGTLYDVLDKPVVAGGNALVNATGFNVTCGYLKDLSKLKFDKTLGYWQDKSNTYKIPLTRKRIHVHIKSQS
jgi:hypothetical protein